MIESAPAQKPRPVTIVDEGPSPIFYTNHVNIDGSPHDVRLRLGVMVGSDPQGLKVKELAHVYMSHSHALALFEALKAARRAIASRCRRVKIWLARRIATVLVWVRTRQQRREARQRQKQWQQMDPYEQFAFFMITLDQNPQLRKEFRKVLRVRGIIEGIDG